MGWHAWCRAGHAVRPVPWCFTGVERNCIATLLLACRFDKTFCETAPQLAEDYVVPEVRACCCWLQREAEWRPPAAAAALGREAVSRCTLLGACRLLHCRWLLGAATPQNISFLIVATMQVFRDDLFLH